MIGQTLSHYRILRKLGAGGMGEVYLAEDDRLGRKLALKILPEQFMQDASRVRRFEQEARAASGLNHPNIITIYEIGHEAGVHFIATEFIEGETLRAQMATEGVSIDEALEIAIQTTSALQAAHSAGIAHRDIKPDNLMLRPDGYVKVLDFGLAKLTEMGGGETGDLEEATRSLLQTQPGIVMGTVAYMSPEQARGQEIDGRTDIFSLGVVLYEMITGQRPFKGSTTTDLLVSLLTSEPQPLAEVRPGVPAEFEPILARMLAKNRDARYATAQELLADLKRLKARFASMDETSTARFNAPTIAAAAPAEKTFATQAAAPAAAQTNYETNVIQAADPTANVTAAVVQATRPRRLLEAAYASL